MKDAFDRPFRNGGTSTLSQSQAQEDSETSNATGSTLQAPLGQRAPPDVRMPPPPTSSKDKGKGRATETDRDIDAEEHSSPSPPPTLTGVVPRSKAPRPREESPPWDIELDITTPSPPPARQAPKRAREESPVWDLELDLNPSDIEEAEKEIRAKRRR